MWSISIYLFCSIFRFFEVKILQDPQILLALTILGGEVILSTLVEVNLGTSFRHRSIILVPFFFLYVRLAQRASEQKEKELVTI
jgi:hypothetical protein